MKDLDLYRMEFKKQLLGGYDKLDVLKKMQQLNSKYQNLMQNQKEFYEGIIKEMQENGVNNTTTTKVIHVYADSNANVKPSEPKVKENLVRENNTEKKVVETNDVERKYLLNELNRTIDSMNVYKEREFNYYEDEEPEEEIEENKEEKIELRFIDDNTTKVEDKEIEKEEVREAREKLEEIEAKVEDFEEDEPSLFADVEETNFFSYNEEDESEDILNQCIVAKIDEIMSSSFEERENNEEVEDANEEMSFTSAVKEIEDIEREIVSRTQEIISEKPEKKKRRERGAIREIEVADEEKIAKKRAARRRKLQKAGAKKTVKEEKAEKPAGKKRRERGAIQELKSED